MFQPDYVDDIKKDVSSEGVYVNVIREKLSVNDQKTQQNLNIKLREHQYDGMNRFVKGTLYPKDKALLEVKILYTKGLH